MLTHDLTESMVLDWVAYEHELAHIFGGKALLSWLEFSLLGIPDGQFLFFIIIWNLSY